MMRLCGFRGLGLGYKRVARIIWEKYGVRLNPGMIYKWISGGRHPLGRCNRIVEGPGLAYVVGAWFEAVLYDLLKRARVDDTWILKPYLEEYPAEACRGFFDAEGSVNIDRYQIAAYNTDPGSLVYLRSFSESSASIAGYISSVGTSS